MKLKTHLLLGMALACLNLFGATYYWNGGTITDLTSWPTTKGGSTPAPNFSTSGDIWDLNLASSTSVDLSGWLMAGTMINSAAPAIVATLTTASGNFTSTHVGAVWVVPAANLVVSGISVIYSSAGSTIPGLTYENLILSNSTGTMTAAAAITVNGNLTTTSGGTLAMGAFQLTFSASGTTLTNGGTITTTVNNAFVDSRSAKIFGGTVVYDRLAGARNVSVGDYNNLTIGNSSGIYSAAGPISVSGNLTTTAGGTFSFGSGVLTLSQTTTTLTNNGTILIYDAIVDARTTKTYGGTIAHNRPTGGRNVNAGSYNNLTMTNISGTYSALGLITVSGTLDLSAGGTFDMGTHTLTLGGSSTLTNNGTITSSATAPFTDGRTTKTFGGIVTLRATSGGQTVAPGNYSTLILSNTSGTNSAGGAITVSSVLTISNAAGILGIGANTLTVASFAGPGHIRGAATSNIVYTGSTASFLYMDSATDGTTNRLNSLTLSSSALLNLGNTLCIHGNTSNSLGDLVLGSSSTLASNTAGSDAAKLKLKLSSSNTPAIIALNGGTVAGEMYYEDYLNAGYRGYRQWGHCLDSASGMALNQITDDINLYADVTSGAGGRGSSGNINGLLASTSSAKNAVFTYDESLFGTSSRWVPFKVNGSNALYAPKGKGLHFVLRPTGTTESGSYDAQVIDYEGQPNTTADVTVSVTRSTTLGSNDGWNLLSNPYPSYLNWASFVSDNSASLKNTTSQALYKYDKATKNYKATTLSGAKWYSSSSVDLGTNPSIDPGDAFFTQIASGASTLTFKRSQTTATRQSSIDRTNKLEIDTTTYSTLYIKMRSASDSTIGDEATVISGSWGGDMKYGAGDALNLGGTCMDLSIIASDDQKLAFKTVSNKSSWLIPLYMTACTQGDYTFDFSINANKSGTEGQYELVDNFKKTKKALKDGDRVLYQITGDSNSIGSGRFYLNSIMNAAGVDGMATTEQSWLVYPNPTTADGEFSIANPKGSATSVTIVNALGGVVHAHEIKANELGVTINLSPLHLLTGVYYIHMTNRNQQSTERLIIRNN